MTEDEREDLIFRLLEEFKKSIGSGFDKQLGMGFTAGARAALASVNARLSSSDEFIPMPELVEQMFRVSGLSRDEFEKNAADILNQEFKDDASERNAMKATLHIEMAATNPPKPLGVGVFVEGKIAASLSIKEVLDVAKRLAEIEASALSNGE